MRVDAHQHYWRFDPVRDSWITPEMAVIRRDFLPADAAPLLAHAGIDAVVAVQADQSEAETDFLLALAAEHDFIRGVVGWVDLRAPDLSERLSRWKGASVLKGFRHVAQSEPDDFLAQLDVIAAIARLGEYGFTYDILVYPRQLSAALQLVQQCPGVQFVLDHCAKPPIASGDVSAWRSDFARIAAHANVTCKLSGLVTEASWSAWTDADLFPVLDAAAETFGPERLMFASDWPVCLLASAYPRLVDVVERWAECFTADERERVFGGTAEAVYSLTTPQTK